jgi:exodeoxyribonuclease VII large subunit
MGEQLLSRRTRFGGLAGRLHALSPLATLERGYAVARDADGRTLSSVADFRRDGTFTLRMRDGEVDAEARSVRAMGGGTA